MFSAFRFLLIYILIGCMAPACATRSIKSFDFIKFPQFKGDVKDLGGYPSVADAPAAPARGRSASQWDAAVLLIKAKRLAQTDVDALGEALALNVEKGELSNELYANYAKIQSQLDKYKDLEPKDLADIYTFLEALKLTSTPEDVFAKPVASAP